MRTGGIIGNLIAKNGNNQMLRASNRYGRLTLLLLAMLSGGASASFTDGTYSGGSTPLFDNLGSLRYPITTTHPTPCRQSSNVSSSLGHEPMLDWLLQDSSRDPAKADGKGVGTGVSFSQQFQSSQSFGVVLLFGVDSVLQDAGR